MGRSRIYFLTGFFFLYGLIGLLCHEMWRDELQAWMLARDNLSIPQMIFNLRYEGHPPLWHILLFLISRFTSDPVYMQFLHLLIGTACVWLFVRFAPFGFWQKALCVFGSLMSYEYLIKSRNYSLGILLLFIACVLYLNGKRKEKKARNLFPVFAALFLASQANFVTAVLSLVYGAFLFLESRLIPRAFFACTAGLLALQTRLPADTYYPLNLTTIPSQFDPSLFLYALDRIRTSYFGIPLLLPNLNPDLASGVLLSSGLFLFFLLVFARKPAVLLLYLTGTLGLLAFCYVKIGGIYDRHAGFLFIHLVICLWLASGFPPRDIRPRLLNTCSLRAKRYAPVVISLMFLTQFTHGIRLTYADIRNPYSAAKEVSLFIKKNYSLDETIFMGLIDSYTSAVAGYLNRPLYYVQAKRFGTYIVWDKKRLESLVTPADIIHEAEKLRMETGKEVLLILNFRLRPQMEGGRLTLVKVFADALNTEERYCLYSFN